MNTSIIHDNKEIFFTVERRSRRTTAIQVHPDQSVRVLAPKFSTERAIRRLVAERASWIQKKQSEFAARPNLKKPHRFVNGESFSYLGEEYQLIVSEGRPLVRLEGSRFEMYAPIGYETEKRRKLMQNWYRKQSKKIFAQRMPHCMRSVSAIGIKLTPEWKIRVLKRSWGSCSPKGKLNLNLELVAAPIELIDYVILHELCHLKELNHSPKYYALMSAVCPDWKMRRKELRDISADNCI